MSHTANLRNRHRPEAAYSPSSKRRKLSAAGADSLSVDLSNHKLHSLPLTNGAHHGKKPFSVVPTPDVKVNNKSHVSESNVRIAQNDSNGIEKVNGELSPDDSGESSSEVDDDESDDDDNIDTEAKTNGLGGSDQSSSEDDDEDNEDLRNPKLVNGFSSKHKTSNEVKKQKAKPEKQKGNKEAKEAEEETQPTFADLLLSRTNADGGAAAEEDEINIDQSYAISHPHAANATALSTLRRPSLPTSSRSALPIPTSTTTLSTVLTQALRTNDQALLESCFRVPQLESIRATIERLHSSYAATLLQKLAERLHKRPGRAGSLMVWVQWTIVAHGGYLASQPHAMKELQTLYRVVKQRATGLQPLLALKGKLDMLEAQMQFRRGVQARSQGLGRKGGSFEEGVTYIEGQEDSEESGDDVDEGDVIARMRNVDPTTTSSTGGLRAGTRKPRARNQNRNRRGLSSRALEAPKDTLDEESDISDGDSSEQPRLNGVKLPNGVNINEVADSDGESLLDDNESDADADEKLTGFIDDEAEETSDEDDDGLEETEDDEDDEELDDEVDFSDDDDEADSDDGIELKMKTKSKAGPRRR